VKKTKPPRTDQHTRERLIKVATRLFARHGFDGISIRQITTEARANIGAVNYHFESKDELIRQVFQSISGPINKARLSHLDQYEAEAGDGPLTVEKVARALIEPAVRLAGDAAGGFYLTRLLVLARALPNPFIDAVLAEEFDIIFHRFVQAFSRALPSISYEGVCWRYDFSIGAMLHAVGYFDGSSRIKRVTGNLCDPHDVERIIDQLVAFVVGGLSSDMRYDRVRASKTARHTVPELQKSISAKARAATRPSRRKTLTLPIKQEHRR
jgi:AcrR family transcriptional regulator